MISPVRLTEELVSLAVCLQSLELLTLRQIFAQDGIWRPAIIEKEFRSFPRAIQLFLRLSSGYAGFSLLLVLRLLLGIALAVYPSFFCAALLLFSTVLICLRFRGTFNGGSDYMTVVLLGSLSFIEMKPSDPKFVLAGLWFIALQSCLSYFIAGVVKLKSASWRRGEALPAFVSASVYDTSRFLNAYSRFALIFSWGIIVFECLAPVIFLDSRLCFAFIVCAGFFHLTNVFVFGLNRFFFVWLATYPALYFCSQLTN